jgi:hypothetical protein
MLRRNEIGSVKAGMPDALGGLLISARESISEASHDASSDGERQLEGSIEERRKKSGSLHPGTGGITAL